MSKKETPKQQIRKPKKHKPVDEKWLHRGLITYHTGIPAMQSGE